MAIRCLLVGASPEVDKGLAAALARGSYDWIVGVDGGCDALARHGVQPHAAFGDFDSLGRIPDETCGHVQVFNARKDFTDLDWALAQTLERGFNDAVVCGALGGRLDHTVGNLQLLTRQARAGQRTWFVGDAETVVALQGAEGTADIDDDGVGRGSSAADRLEFRAGAVGTCSVFAATPQAFGVAEKGLAYQLDDATLESTVPLGVSNELVGQPASISVRDGSLWVFFPTALLDAAMLGGTPWR